MMLFPWFAQLVSDKDTFDTKQNNLNESQNLDAKKTIEAIYPILTVLDQKASALMRLDGVVLAAAFVGVAARVYNFKSVVFGGIAIPCMLSMILCLLVVSVDWPFLGYAKKDDFSEEIAALRRVRYFRECAFRWAWSFAFISALVLLVFLLWEILWKST
jgi:hypothetical protein